MSVPELKSDDDGVRFAERGSMSAGELRELFDITAQKLLGVSGEEALVMLEDGSLDGTAAESTLQGLRFLLTSG